MHHNLELIKQVACAKAKEHNCNYTIIIMNPDKDGNYNRFKGSTYEFVADSYWNEPRPNAIKLATTDEIFATGYTVTDPVEVPKRSKKIGVVGAAIAMLDMEEQKRKHDDVFLIENPYVKIFNDETNKEMAIVKAMQEPFTKNNTPKHPGTQINEPVRNSATNPKINRNAPCPCGSGKKYKNCCLKNNF